MSKIPCRKCKKCGKYSDLASLICICGEDIGEIPGGLVETSDLSAELIAEIDEDIEVFVQKCSACGALNFSLDKDEPVKMCCNCHKARIATVAPVKYSCDELENHTDRAEDSALDFSKEINVINKVSILNNTAASAIDDDDASPWMNILGGIKAATGNLVSETREVTVTQRQNTTQVANIVDDDDDEVDAGNWESILGGNTRIKTVAGKNKLTIIAVRYGQFSYTIKKIDLPLLLGRDANLKEFLSHDQRVSNEHCYIDYENNNWIVRDNNSSNGTAVNSKDIGYGGKKSIQNGDLLKLGHHQDSMEFKVLIE